MFSASKSKGASSGYQITNSLRFRASASAYLNRTFASNGTSTTTKTISFWVKRGLLDSSPRNLISGYDGSSGNDFSVMFDTSSGYVGDGFRVSCGGAAAYDIVTSSVFRDPSAWYYFVIAFDTTQAVPSNRVKIYVNGSQLTAFNTANYPAQNASIGFGYGNSNNKIGARWDSGARYFDGYMAEVNFIDGQALTPSSFGSINATTGVWQPARYTGSYGTNGFYLKFNNGTSTTTLGNDSSGNGNNWTTNNISLTAGSTYDWMIDSPTSYAGSSYGVGNYAVLNPLNVNGSTLSEANLKATYIVSTNANSQARGTFAVASGKWYWEVLLSNVVSGCLIGIVKSDSAYNVGFNTANSWLYYSANGTKWNGSSSAYASSSTTGTIIGVALDSDVGTLTFYKNGTSLGQAFSGLAGISLSPVAYDDAGNNTTVLAFNFGQRPFAYTPPTGFKSLCTQNLPAPAIYNGANHMAATTYTGTGATQSISNSVNSASFQPDFVWIKSRSAATDHALYDVIRGTQNRLESNTTDAAVAADNGLTAFGSAGFTVNTLAQVNTSAATYVGWQWKAGGTAVTNTSGSITSQVSANTTAGFSVVTFTAQSSGTGTVGHGLGVAPSMIILKQMAQVGSWGTYHTSLGNTQRLLLNTTDAAVTTSTYWNNTSPTSSVFTIGTGFATAGTMVAYCFAAIPGYSAFGSYTGNGSTDGPFVYTGFRPRWLLIKDATSSNNWQLLDTSRDIYNVAPDILQPNLSNAESAFGTGGYDFLSNGFKVRTSSTSTNTSGYTIIYAAFAENPFQNSLAR